MASESGEQTTQDEPSALDSLAGDQRRGRILVAKADSDFSVGATRVWLATVRNHLKKIYGTNSNVLLGAAMLEGPVPKVDARRVLQERLLQLEQFLESVGTTGRKSFSTNGGKKIFIGHGRSPVWREIKDFISERLKLPWDEFNRESTPGLTTFERLSQMLDDASFAFLVMTAEDEHSDSTFHARENVIHEVGLFQGRLGPRKAIILLENECKEFSNIHGLSQIRFPPGHTSAAFEDIRRVLERENILASGSK